MKSDSRRYVCGVLIFAFLFAWGCGRSENPAGNPRDANEADKKLTDYRQVIQELDAQIKADGAAVVQIPQATKAFDVQGGRIFVTTVNGSKAVLLPTWLGKGSNLCGYLYVMGDLKALSPITANGQAKVNLLVPAPTATGTSISPVTITPTADKSWFQAENVED